MSKVVTWGDPNAGGCSFSFDKRLKFQQFVCPGLVRGKAVKDQLHDVQAVKDELFYGWFPDQSFQICRDFTDSRGWQTVGLQGGNCQ